MIPFHFIVPAFLLVIAAEWALSRKHQPETYNWKDLRTNIMVGIGGAVFSSLLKRAIEIWLFFGVFEACSSWRQHWLGYDSLGWAWWIWILAILGDDFNFYWHHRFSHEIRILWAAHVVHHSSRFFNYSTGLRNGWTALLYKHFWWVWMPALGFEPAMVTAALIINAIYQFSLHTKHIRRFWLPEAIFVSPMLHEVHHASNVRYLDKNYAGIFVFWDKLFGTFQKNESEKEAIVYGISDDLQNRNAVYLHLHEPFKIWQDLKQANSLSEAWRYVFGRPGWAPNGASRTSKARQAALYEQNPAPYDALP
jgi:sterol desaturase/sphingolipid hydroxylase (fatty acid hydroxylase superfamily)